MNRVIDYVNKSLLFKINFFILTYLNFYDIITNIINNYETIRKIMDIINSFSSWYYTNKSTIYFVNVVLNDSFLDKLQQSLLETDKNIILLNESSLSVSINEYIHMLKHLPIDIILYVDHWDFDIIVQNYSDNNSTYSNNREAKSKSTTFHINLINPNAPLFQLVKRDKYNDTDMQPMADIIQNCKYIEQPSHNLIQFFNVQFTSAFLNQLKQSLLQDALKLHCFDKHLNPDEYIQLILDSQRCDFYFNSEYFNFDIVLYKESNSCQQIFHINLTNPNKPLFNWIKYR